MYESGRGYAVVIISIYGLCKSESNQEFNCVTFALLKNICKQYISHPSSAVLQHHHLHVDIPLYTEQTPHYI